MFLQSAGFCSYTKMIEYLEKRNTKKERTARDVLVVFYEFITSRKTTKSQRLLILYFDDLKPQYLFYSMSRSLLSLLIYRWLESPSENKTPTPAWTEYRD